MRKLWGSPSFLIQVERSIKPPNKRQDNEVSMEGLWNVFGFGNFAQKKLSNVFTLFCFFKKRKKRRRSCHMKCLSYSGIQTSRANRESPPFILLGLVDTGRFTPTMKWWEGSYFWKARGLLVVFDGWNKMNCSQGPGD